MRFRRRDSKRENDDGTNGSFNMHYEIEQAAEKDPKTFLDSVRRKYEGGSSETQYTYIFRKLLQNDFPETLKNAIKK